MNQTAFTRVVSRIGPLQIVIILLLFLLNFLGYSVLIATLY